MNNINDFRTTTLPIGVVDLFDQQLNKIFVSKYLSKVFNFSISSKLHVNQRPRILNFGGFQFMSRWGSHLILELILLPSQTLFVLSVFNLSPDISPK